jgi:hypothetical protein
MFHTHHEGQVMAQVEHQKHVRTSSCQYEAEMKNNHNAGAIYQIFG